MNSKSGDDLSANAAQQKSEAIAELPRLVRNLLSSIADVTGKKVQLSEDARRKDIRTSIMKANLR